MWRLSRAEWRAYWWLNLLGPALMGLLAGLIARELSTETCCPPAPSRELYLAKLLFAGVVYCHVPLIVYAQNGLYGSRVREQLGQTLPLTTREQNDSRIVTALLFLPVGLLTSVGVLSLWWHFGHRVSPWLFASATLTPLLFLLICMRRSVLRYTIPLAFALIWIPSSEALVAPLLRVAGSAWGVLGLVLAILWGQGRVRRRLPPPWSRQAS